MRKEGNFPPKDALEAGTGGEGIGISASVAEAKLGKPFLFLFTILSFSTHKGDTLQVTYFGLKKPMYLSQKDQEIQIRALQLTSWPRVFLLSEIQFPRP